MNLIELTNRLMEKCHIRTYSELDFFRGVLEQWHRWDSKKFHGIYPIDAYLSLCHAVFDNLLEVTDMKEPSMTAQTFDFTILFLEQFMCRDSSELAGVELNNILR